MALATEASPLFIMLLLRIEMGAARHLLVQQLLAAVTTLATEAAGMSKARSEDMKIETAEIEGVMVVVAAGAAVVQLLVTTRAGWLHCGRR